ncbi:MAG: hypothetical protein M3400_16480 [Actinomycetota bacterium]|nr:hypothetical protein [Actinomycetota bacterium]
MHIRITPLVAAPDAAIAQVEQRLGLISAYVLRPMDQQRPVLVTVWETAAHAELASVTAGGQDFVAAGFEPATSVGDDPAYGQFVYFDGPRSPAETAAIDRAHRERLAPAVRDVPGTVGAFVGRNPEGSFVVLVLTTSLQALEDGQTAVLSSELLSGEDPALLPGPDRIQIAWVLAASARAVALPV